MKTILRDITVLRGIHNACFYKEGNVVASTFPPEKQKSIYLACQTIHKLFLALGNTQESHNELYFYIDDLLIIAYRTDENSLMVLSTETDANHALAQMGVRSAIEKIEQLPPAKATQDTISPLEKKPKEPSDTTHTTANIITPIPSSLFTQLEELLINYLGPVTSFIFNDHHTQWNKTHSASMENVTTLIDMLATELDSDNERTDFLVKANELLK